MVHDDDLLSAHHDVVSDEQVAYQLRGAGAGVYHDCISALYYASCGAGVCGILQYALREGPGAADYETGRLWDDSCC